MTGFDAEMKGTKEPLAEEVGVQMTARGRCASRSGAGKPAFDLCKLGCNMLFGFEKVNWRQSEQDHPSRTISFTRFVRTHALSLHPERMSCRMVTFMYV